MPKKKADQQPCLTCTGVPQVPLTYSPDLTPLRQQMQRTKLNSQANTARLSLPANLRMSPRLEIIGNLFAVCEPVFLAFLVYLCSGRWGGKYLTYRTYSWCRVSNPHPAVPKSLDLDSEARNSAVFKNHMTSL